LVKHLIDPVHLPCWDIAFPTGTLFKPAVVVAKARGLTLLVALALLQPTRGMALGTISPGLPPPDRWAEFQTGYWQGKFHGSALIASLKLYPNAGTTELMNRALPTDPPLRLVGLYGQDFDLIPYAEGTFWG
jgi:hypothetical protein